MYPSRALICWRDISAAAKNSVGGHREHPGRGSIVCARHLDIPLNFSRAHSSRRPSRLSALASSRSKPGTQVKYVAIEARCSAAAAADAAPGRRRGPGPCSQRRTPSSSTVVASASLNEASFGHVEQLMRELVKNDRGQFDVVPAHHGVENGIVEMAERGIGRHAADHDVETRARSSAAKRRARLDEVAAIGHAADDGIAPLLGIDGEFRRGHHVPHHVGRPTSA
jgi:hypothetical protein